MSLSDVRWKSARPFYARVLLGDFDLPIAFFVIGVCGIAGLAILSMLPAWVETTDLHGLSWLSLLVRDTSNAVTAIILLLIANCVWRSAGRYQRQSLWPRLARTVVVAGAIGLAIPYVLPMLERSATTVASAIPEPSKPDVLSSKIDIAATEDVAENQPPSVPTQPIAVIPKPETPYRAKRSQRSAATQHARQTGGTPLIVNQ